MIDRPALPGVFTPLYHRVTRDPSSEGARVIVDFAVAILAGAEFDLSRIDRLRDSRDAELCAALFDFCLTVGLTEDERQAALAALAPYAAMHAAGTRH